MSETTMLLKLALIGLCAMTTRASFTPDEAEVILATLKLHSTKNCILVSEATEENSKDVIKKLNENLISTGLMTVKTLGMFLRESRPPDAPTAVVIKVDASSKTTALFTQNYERLYWFIWFLITTDDLDEAIRIPFNCQLYKIQKGNKRTLRLIEIYHIKNSSAYTSEFGVWTPEGGLNAFQVDIYKKRSDMKGIGLTVMMRKRYIGEKKINEFWRDSARILNFTLIEKDPNLDDMSDIDGTTYMWGLTGADSERDWIFFSFGLKVRLAVKFRSSNEVGWRAYVQPFTYELWTAIGLWLSLSTVAIITVGGCNSKATYTNIYTGLYCMCNSDPTVTHPPDRPMTVPVKLVYLLTMVVPSVIIPAYSAYILSTLSVILPLEPFQDLKSFTEDGTYRLALVNRSFAVRYFNVSNDPVIKYINNNLLVKPGTRPVDFTDMFRQLCKNVKLTGLFIDTEPYRQLFQCRVSVIQQEVMIITAGIQLPKGSPFRKILNEKFALYHEKGIKNVNKYAKRENYINDEANRVTSLNMTQTRAIFLLIPLSIILSFLILAAEIAVKKGFWSF